MRPMFVAILCAAFPAAAMAEQQPAQPPQSPVEQAFSVKLMAEISANLQCSVNVISLQRELDAANAKIKALEAK